MKITSHSEYLKLETVFIKSVKDAFVSKCDINTQWKELNYLSQPNFDMAITEYEAFKALLKDSKVDLKYFPKDNSVKIDSIYCRDASIATDFGMILCNMGKEGRIHEPNSQRVEYLKNNIPVFGEIYSPGTLEGGDVAWLDEKTLAVGYTYRTNEEGIKQLKQLLEPK